MPDTRQFMMPNMFGPQPGPRNNATDERFPVPDNRRYRTFGGVVGAREDRLKAILPDRFSLRGDPQLITNFFEICDIDWLAGRHYNMLTVCIAVTVDTDEGPLDGLFMPVLWENLADPILTGREQLGFNKVYGSLPNPRTYQGQCHISGLWEGHRFFEGQITRGQPADATFAARASAWLAPGSGIFHVKYVPRTGGNGAADIHQVVLSPSTDFGAHEGALWQATPQDWQFLPARWDQMPTQAHIVTKLADLQDGTMIDGWMSEARGAGDFCNQRIVHDYLANM